jgi:hypothetical protein
MLKLRSQYATTKQPVPGLNQFPLGFSMTPGMGSFWSQDMEIPSTAKQIIGFNGYYIDRDGSVYSKKRKPTRKLHSHCIGFVGNKYWSVVLSVNGKSYLRKIHRLLGMAFIENPNNNPCVLHRNDNRSDNRLENLYWGTYKDNVRDSVLNNTRNIVHGTSHGNAVLTESDIPRIRLLASKGKSHRFIARVFGVTRANISLICSRKGWNHVR